MCGCEGRAGGLPSAEDGRIQAAVLGHLLMLYPAPSTPAELVRELAVDGADFDARDDLERAVRDLVAVGLLHDRGGWLLPTRAAVCCAALPLA